MHGRLGARIWHNIDSRNVPWQSSRRRLVDTSSSSRYTATEHSRHSGLADSQLSRIEMFARWILLEHPSHKCLIWKCLPVRRIVDKIALQKLSIAGAFSVGLYWILVGLYWILASTCALIKCWVRCVQVDWSASERYLGHWNSAGNKWKLEVSPPPVALSHTH